MDLDKELLRDVPAWALSLDPGEMLEVIDYLHRHKGEVITDARIPQAESGSVNAMFARLSVMGFIENRGQYWIIPEDFGLPNEEELIENLDELRQQMDSDSD